MATNPLNWNDPDQSHVYSGQTGNLNGTQYAYYTNGPGGTQHIAPVNSYQGWADLERAWRAAGAPRAPAPQQPGTAPGSRPPPVQVPASLMRPPGSIPSTPPIGNGTPPQTPGNASPQAYAAQNANPSGPVTPYQYPAPQAGTGAPEAPPWLPAHWQTAPAWGPPASQGYVNPGRGPGGSKIGGI